MTKIIERSIKVTGHIHGILRGPDGMIKEEFEQDNLVVTLGLENLNDLITGVGGSALTHLGVGWAEPDSEPGAPALTDINLPMPGGTPPWVGGYQNRKAAVVTQLSPTQFKLTVSWVAGEPATTANWPKAIRCIGAFIAAGTGDNEIFAWTKRAPINKANADTIEFVYTFTLA